VYDNNSKTCEVDQKLAQLFECTNLELKRDNLPGCVCAEGQKFNARTRKCLEECDEVFEKNCERRNARECKFENRQAKCLCKQEDIPFTNDPRDNSNWTCVHKCEELLSFSKELESKR